MFTDKLLATLNKTGLKLASTGVLKIGKATYTIVCDGVSLNGSGEAIPVFSVQSVERPERKPRNPKKK